jgi:hypothetical protein
MIAHGEEGMKERSSISYCAHRDNVIIENKLSQENIQNTHELLEEKHD